jgi:hypothetical protein
MIAKSLDLPLNRTSNMSLWGRLRMQGAAQRCSTFDWSPYFWVLSAPVS